jgi:LPXTG-motif cell wall-anchored protein
MRRQILSRSLLTVAAASSILAVTGGIASADSDTGARNTPGHSADDQAAAQTAQGGQGGQHGQGAQDDSAAGSRSSGAGASGATAEGRSEGSPGVLSGNNLSAPVDVPVNVCGNSVDVVGLLNPTFGNHCANGAAPAPEAPPQQQDTPPPAPPKANPPEVHTQLAETGTSGGMVGTAAGAGAVMLLGGAMLYRRSTRAARVRRTHS